MRLTDRKRVKKAKCQAMIRKASGSWLRTIWGLCEKLFENHSKSIRKLFEMMGDLNGDSLRSASGEQKDTLAGKQRSIPFNSRSVNRAVFDCF